MNKGGLMKKVATILGLVIISSTVFAANESAACKSQVLAQAASIKSQTKQQIRGTEDLMDAQLDKAGDPTVGMGTRGMTQGAHAILVAVRVLQQDSSAQLDSVLEQLCKNNFDVEKTISE